MQPIEESSQPGTEDERLVSVMQALGDKTRYKMFKLLVAGHGMCVSEIAKALDISVPAVSQHFRIFELVGLVEPQRLGQRVCYVLRADDPLVQEIIQLAK